jgi:hypothetical protein
VAGREVVGPRHVRGDATHGLDGRARHRGRLPAGAVGEDPRRRKVAVEFLRSYMEREKKSIIQTANLFHITRGAN